MSTYWGYVCLSHDPELISDRWWNHGNAALMDLYLKMRQGTWPIITADVPHVGLAFEGEPYSAHPVGLNAEPALPTRGGGTPPWLGPPAWLMEHPRCKVALRSEYGEMIDLPEVG